MPNLTAPVSWTYMLSYIAFMLILPISGLLYKASGIPWQIFLARATEPVALHAYYVTFSMAIVAAAINCFFGFLLAWVLTKYKFPGKKWIDAAVDLPFALPTSVAGLTLATVYGDEFFIGQFLQSLGINVRGVGGFGCNHSMHHGADAHAHAVCCMVTHGPPILPGADPTHRMHTVSVSAIPGRGSSRVHSACSKHKEEGGG